MAPLKTETTDRKSLPESHQKIYRIKLQALADQWRKEGLPSAESLGIIADQLEADKQNWAIDGIWDQKPLIVTATLDDGIGQGLSTIHLFSRVIGLEIHALGLLQPPETIIEACKRLRPDFLGLTVLQLDSDDNLARVGHGLPSPTRLIAGGPAFRFDPEMADRCGVHFVARDVARFVDFMCRWR